MVVADVLTGNRTPVKLPPNVLKSSQEPTGTGPKYLRYLTIGGRPGRAKARTKTTPAVKLQRQARGAAAASATDLKAITEELKTLREEISTIER